MCVNQTANEMSEPKWAEIQLRFKAELVGTDAPAPKSIYVYAGTVAYVESDGKCFSHQISQEAVPSGGIYDCAYLVRFCENPPFMAEDKPEAEA